MVATYFKEYDHDASLEDKSTEAYQKVWNAAKAELAMRAILKAKRCQRIYYQLRRFGRH